MNKPATRLFVDAHCFDKEFQGSRTFVQELYKELSQKKDLAIFMAANNAAQLEKHFPPAGNIRFLKYRFRSPFLRLAYEIPQLIKKYEIDIAHFQYITPLWKNCRQVVTMHDVIFSDYPSEFSFFYRLQKKLLYKRAATTADILTTVSPFSKTSIQKHLSSRKDVFIVANGVNQKLFQPFDKEEARKLIQKKYKADRYVLYVSRIEPRKNHLALLNAFLRLKLYEKGYSLVFIGHTSISISSLKKALAGLHPSCRKYILLLSNIPEADLHHFYQAADVFVYPSKAEGFGIPPLEAAACRVPVICSNTSAMADYTFFEDWHIDPNNELLLERKLLQLTTKPACPQRLQAIADKVRSQYSWKDSADHFYQLIKNTNQ